MAQILPGIILISLVVKTHQLTEKSATFWHWLTPIMSESQLFLYNDSSIVRRMIEVMWTTKEKI